MYYQYWGLQKPAFDNVPDPSMYADCHASMETAIAETLFAIEEGDECVAVVVGDVGLGKTLSIRMIIDLLNPDHYKIALITNPGISFVQILQEIIGQLTDTQCEEKRKLKLLEMFNRLLFSTFAEGRKILIFIDEANAISPVNLESLRLLTNMQGDKRNLFTLVLAGQIEFAKRLEHPKRANLFQRVGTYCRIDKLGSAVVVRKYVETRLMLAGATQQIFSDDAFDRLWEHSGHGVPRLINKLCKLCLKAGETNKFTRITGEMVNQIGARFQNLTGPTVQQRRPRKRVEKELPAVLLPAIHEEQLFVPEDEHEDDAGRACEAESINVPDEPEEQHEAGQEGGEDAETSLPAEPWCQGLKLEPEPEPEEICDAEEICINNVNVSIKLPEYMLKEPLAFSVEHRYKMAGAFAAETLKNNPQLVTAHFADPVPVWQEIRDFVLDRMAHAQSSESLGRQATGS